MLIPVLRREFIADSSFSDMVNASINIAARKLEKLFTEGAISRLSRDIVGRAEGEATHAFIEQIDKAIGVDLSLLINNEGLSDYLDVATELNIVLIKSLADDYLEDVRSHVLNGYLRGEPYTVIAKRIQAATGAAYKRCAFIAHDQAAKIRSDITIKRQVNIGFTRSRWSTSKDVRVSGNPAGKYPNAKIKCFMIARQDNGYGAGVFLLSDGVSYAGESKLYPGRAHPGCRCSSTPLIPGVDY